MTNDQKPMNSNLLGVVNQLCQEGRYDDALELVNKLCDAVRPVVGEKSFQYASLFQKVADIYRQKGDWPAAEKAYRQTADILRETAEPNHPLLGDVLNGLGLVLRSENRLDEAEPYLTEGTAIFKEAFGENSGYYVMALNNLAELYTTQGRYNQAIDTYEQLLAIQRQLPGQPTASLGQRLSRLGELYYEMARYQDTRKIFEEAARVARQLYGDNHLNYASSLSSLALQHKMLGAWDQAEALYKQAIQVAKATVGEDDPYYVMYLNNLSNLYHAQGRYREAVQLMRQVTAFSERHLNKDDPRYAATLNNHGVMLLALGQTEEAEALFRQALEIDSQIFGKGHPQTLQDSLNLATVLMQTQQWEEATRYLQQAGEAGKAFGSRHPALARILGAQSKILLHIGQFNQAEAFAVMAQEIWRTTVGPDHPNYAEALVDMGWVARAKGQYEDAERVTIRALDIYRRREAQEIEGLTSALRLLVGLGEATGRPDTALDYMQELTEVDGRWIGQIFSVGNEDQRLTAATSLLSDIYLFVSLAREETAAVPRAFDLVLRRKAIGSEAMAAQRDAVLGGRYPTLAAQFQELLAWRMQIGQKTLAGPGPEGLETHQKLLAEWTARRESLEVELAQKIPELNLERHLRSVDRQAVAQALPEASVLVEFLRFDGLDFKAVPARGEPYWHPAHYMAFVLLAGEPDNVKMIDLGEAAPIEHLIAAFRNAISGGDRSLSPDEEPALKTTHGADLRRAVFDPLLAALAGCRRLFLAPDGDLSRLPFETLPTDAGGRLLDDYQFSYLGTGRDVLRFGGRSQGQAASPLVVADPDFDLGLADRTILAGPTEPPGRQSRALDPRALQFKPLPGTRQEGEDIAALLGVQPWLKGEALEGRLKASPSPRLLHIATHGFYLEDQKRAPNLWQLGLGRLSQPLENPLLRSGLALAGANTWLQDKPLPAEAEDGIMTAEDVSGLDLLGTKLVVLSACETGLGAVQVGEGVLGLRRAFVLAGAQTLIISLWKVPDQQTQELMADFYRRILDGQPRAEALRGAQLAMQKNYPEPLYWGAFICQGEPGPL